MTLEPARASDGDEIAAIHMVSRADAMPYLLQLHAFQRNVRARAFYEARGFRAVAVNDRSRNDEGEPDLSYEWKASPAA